MSNLVSEIFYNSKNNGLLNEYLLNRNEIQSKIIPQRQLDKLSSFQISRFETNSQGKYGLMFKITITEADQNDKIYKENSRKQVITKGTLFRLSIKIGTTVLQQIVQSSIQSSLSAKLDLQLTICHIANHRAICIELTKKSKVPLGCCYVPTENIIDMINNKIKNRLFNLSMKPLYGKNEGSIKKLNVICEIGIKELINKNNKCSKISSKTVEYKHTQFNNREYAQLINNSVNKIPLNIDKQKMRDTTNRKVNDDLSKNPIKQQSEAQSKHEMSEWSELEMISKFGGSYSNDTNTNVMKMQLQNKEIKFIIKEYKPNHTSNIHNCTYKFMVTPTKAFKINEQLVINSSQVGKKGITIQIIKVQAHQGQLSDTNEGTFHLNVVVLFSRCICGVFPVNNSENECVGLVNIDSIPSANRDKQQRQLQEKRQIQSSNQYKQLEQQQKEQNNQLIKVYMFQFLKVYILKQTNSRISINSDKSVNIQTVIRIGRNLIKVYRECQMVKLNMLDGKILQIIYKEPIQITEDEVCQCQINKDNNQDKIIQIQIELYQDIQLIGYTKIQHIDHCNKRQQNISYYSALLNMSTNGYICHAAINYINFNIQRSYFPHRKLKESVRYLMDWSIVDIIHKKVKKYGKLERKQCKSQVIQYLMRQNKEMIFIQGERIASLILNSIFSSTYSFIYPHKFSQQTINIKKQQCKFLQQMQYLDIQCTGQVDLNEIKTIAQYYGIPIKLCQMTRKRYIASGKDINSNENNDSVLYLFVLIGNGFKICRGLQLKDEMQQNQGNFNQQFISEPTRREVEQNRQQYNENQQIFNQEEIQQITEINNAIQQNSQIAPPLQTYYIDSIACFQMHTLMTNNSIPSLKIQLLSSKYQTRPYYSSANPVLRVNKKIVEGQTIIIINHNIKLNQDVEIGRIVFKAGKIEYRLGGEARVRVLIGKEPNTY